MPDGQDAIPAPPQKAEAHRPHDALRHVQIERALIDVALLRTFVSSRNDAMLQQAFTDAAFPAKPPVETPTKEEFLRRLAEIERLGAEGVGRDPAATAFLFGARDTLNAVAAPADAYTIAFTGFYTGGVPEVDLLQDRPEFKEMRRQAKTSRVAIGGLALAGVLAVLLAVAVSVHAMLGKTVLDQVRVTATALTALDQEIAAADRAALESFTPRPGIWMAILPPLCERMSLLPSLSGAPEQVLRGFEGPDHWLLCARRQEASFRHDVAKSELATWIDATTGVTSEERPSLTPGAKTELVRVERWTWISWLPGLSVRDIRQHTSYTSEQVGWALLSALGVYYLPVIFGVLGGAVYAVRRLNHKIMSSELHPRDWRHALLRIFMAFLLGGCIGLFFQPGGTKFDGPGGEISLSIAALSFLAGYSVEVVFRFFDLLITQALKVVNAVAPSGTAMPPLR
jgi:hypothetical protein